MQGRAIDEGRRFDVLGAIYYLRGIGANP